MENFVKICSLASGSNGNAYYLEYNGEAMLVDVGISYRQLTDRARTRGIDMRRIKWVFVSHEHSDHVRGLHMLSQKQAIDTYMTRGTANACKPYYMPPRPVYAIDREGTTTVGPFTVHSFAKPHDVKEPCSFRVEAGGISIGVFTDIGSDCDGLRHHLALCHAVFLESNYDEQMLKCGKYPQQLKDRVASNVGHLSNRQAADIVASVAPAHLHTIILSHLSADNNHPKIALREFESMAGRYKISTAGRYEAGEMFTITESESFLKAKPIVIPERLGRCVQSIAG